MVAIEKTTIFIIIIVLNIGKTGQNNETSSVIRRSYKAGHSNRVMIRTGDNRHSVVAGGS